MIRASIVLFVALAASSTARAQSFTETFTNGTNAGPWTYGNGADSIRSTGGNPGFYFRNDNLDTIAPQLRTGAGRSSVFTGDYRARRVASLEVDLKVFSTQFNFQRNLSLILEDDAGTPDDPSDDCSVYVVTGELVPQVAEGWKHFRVPIPSQSATLPPGWVVLGNCSGAPDAAWNSVITDVDRVIWFYGDPALFYIFDLWDTGADNIRIAEEVGSGTCFGDGSNGPCPCANGAGAGEGCRNSTGVGAKLVATGSTSVSADDLVLVATQTKPNALAVALQGSTVLAVPLVYGDGLRCVGGSLKRLANVQASADGTAIFGPGLAARGGWTSGALFGFQVYHRDPTGPCGSGFNATPAVQVTFTN